MILGVIFRRKFCSLALFTFVLYLALTGVAQAVGGSGTQADPYIINTAEELNAVRNNPVDIYYQLGNDIDLTAYLSSNSPAEGWEPIHFFANGGFDGARHKITGLWIKRVGPAGLFAFITNGTVKNLGIEIASAGIRGGGGANTLDGYVGGLAGSLNGGNIENCYVTGNVSGGISMNGGLVGYCYSAQIINCYTTGNVNSNADDDVSGGNGAVADGTVGGLVGLFNDGSIQNCYATGNIDGGVSVGGLVGSLLSANIENCYATGNISGGSGLGGIIGNYSLSTITNCYRHESVTINNTLISENNTNGKHGGIKTEEELLTKETYTSNGWLFNDSTPVAGPWYWESGSLPKLNISLDDTNDDNNSGDGNNGDDASDDWWEFGGCNSTGGLFSVFALIVVYALQRCKKTT